MGKEEKEWEKNAVNKQTNKSEQNKNGRIFNLFSGRKKSSLRSRGMEEITRDF